MNNPRKIGRIALSVASIYLFFLFLIHWFRPINVAPTTQVAPLEEHDLCLLDHQDPAYIAYHDTPSLNCKRYIKRTLCSGTRSHPVHVPNTCPAFDLNKPSKLLGCVEVARYQLMKVIVPNNREPDQCIELCMKTGNLYALVTADHACGCQVTPIENPRLLRPDSCSARCSLYPNPSVKSCGKTVPVFYYNTGSHAPMHLSSGQIQPVDRIPSEPPVRILYLLTWHGRSWLQIRRLFRLIYHSRHYYYIHVDSQSAYLYDQVRQLNQLHLPNVKFAVNRWHAFWGSANLLWMLLDAMHDIVVNLNHWKWDFLINLSGADMPVRNPAEMVIYLSRYRGKIFLRSNPTLSRFALTQAMDRIFLTCETYSWYLGTRPLPTGIILDGGSDWFILPHIFVHYLIRNHADPTLVQMKNYFEYNLLPAESFFHTLAQNTPFCTSVIGDSLRFVNWLRPRGCEDKTEISLSWTGCSPLAFRGSDGLERICRAVGGCRNHAQMTKPLFFARKFDPTLDLSIVNTVATMSGETSTQYDSYWENIYSAKLDSRHAPVSWSKGLPVLFQLHFNKLLAEHPHLRSSISLADGYELSMDVFALFNATSQQKAIETQSVLPYPYLILQAPVFLTQAGMKPANTTNIEILVQTPFLGSMTTNALHQLTYGDIIYAVVNSMFDHKEQQFRNYPGLMSTADKLFLTMTWKGKSSSDSKQRTTVRLHINPPSQCATHIVQTTLDLEKNSHTQTMFDCRNCFVFHIPLYSILPENCSSIAGLWQFDLNAVSGQRVTIQFYLVSFETEKTLSLLDQLLAPTSPWTDPLDYCFHNNNRRSCSAHAWSGFSHYHQPILGNA